MRRCSNFRFHSVDDINALRPDFDVAAAYNAKKAIAAFRHITDPVRSKYLADDTDYDMKVREFRARRDRPDRAAIRT